MGEVYPGIEYLVLYNNTGYINGWVVQGVPVLETVQGTAEDFVFSEYHEENACLYYKQGWVITPEIFQAWYRYWLMKETTQCITPTL